MEIETAIDFLKVWAPTLWYTAGFAGFWAGAGVLTFRSIMRAHYSTGHQRVTGLDPRTTGASRLQANPSADQTVWVYSRAWVLILAAVLGPASFMFALLYRAFDTRSSAADVL